MRKLTKEEVIENVKKLCGSNFTFSLEEYENTGSKVILTCNKCGKTFRRKYNALTYNQTCPYCNGTARIQDTEWFINKASQIHGGKYDYSKSEYCGTDKKLIVICHEKDEFGEEHGEFLVTPHSHIGKMKSGCPKCSGKYRTTTEEFIKKAKKIHGDKYDYSKTIYVRALSPVIITCPEHGDFFQKPNGHLSGQGCPYCKQSHIEKEIRELLIENNIEFKQEYTPEWLKPLHIDFFIPSKNIAIECQGLQHFIPAAYYGGEEGLSIRKEMDERKRKLCKENDITLLYYANYDYDFPYYVIKDKNELLKSIKN